jgi:ATP-dependent DNA helicase DinG
MTPTVDELLDAAVAAIGGSRRTGQHQMAAAVAAAIDGRQHLMVQAGTGTGKSLAYLVPALAHAARGGGPVVVATATIALQRQLVDRDLPLLADVLEPMLDRRPTFGLLKGRQNYLCQHRLQGGESPGDEDALFEPVPTSRAGRDAVRIRAWASTTTTGDRDELVPAPDERAWRSLSVTAHECLGANRCPVAAECFVEIARDHAREADVVVTNHAMLAIDALSEAQLLPEHDVVVVDEGHELADRATGAVTDELNAPMVERAARRGRKAADEDATDLLVGAAGLLDAALAEVPAGRLRSLPSALFDALVAVRDAGHTALTAMGRGSADDDPAARQRARAAVEEVHEIAGRIVAADEQDVVWVTTPERRPPMVWRAPMNVGGVLRDELFGERTVVLTSATLALGGSFDPLSRTLGLTPGDETQWTGLDVGSPFDYPRQGIQYVAAHLPPPGRGGLSEDTLTELTELVAAAGGRALGLFSSMRAAQQAAEELRQRLDLPILCQGDDATGELVRTFAADARTSLFGTLSLWQGVDVPGSACHLVVIDRIPFPRPDDPLTSARQEAVARAGGNGFMAVAATQAALRLAQGSGRLIRTGDDRGVVAVLDSRLANARYAGFLRASLPPMWPTTDGALVRRSLAVLDAAAGPVEPVRDQPGAGEGGKAPPPASTGGDRRGHRWTDAEEGQLVSGFDAGVPVALLADELGRSGSAVTARLRQHGRGGSVRWRAGGAEPGGADRDLADALAAVQVWSESSPPERLAWLAEVLGLSGWTAEIDDGVLHVARGEVDARVGWDNPADLALGEATSRLLLRSAGTGGVEGSTELPTGVDALVTLHMLSGSPPRLAGQGD